MEIERKYLITHLPFALKDYPCHHIEQAYLNTAPVIRIRREDEDYYLTYKSKGLMVREEYNLPLTKEAYLHLLDKADGNLISKKRYKIPLPSGYTAELDVFFPPFDPLLLVEVEFPDEQSAREFQAPGWFGAEVTFSTAYHNSTLSAMSKQDVAEKKFLHNSGKC